MEERNFIRLKKEEFGIKEYIKRNLGKGKISNLDIEYTPIGEKIIISTSRPGLVIGRKGEKIEELTEVLRTRFRLENPHIEIKEITNPLFDAQLVADDIAMALERMGNLKFKVISYKKLAEIMNSGALGCELRISGKLPSERAKSWRFAQGYLKKSGDPAKEIDRASATALTKTGIIGIKVAIMSPDAKIYDKIEIDDKILANIKVAPIKEEEEKTTKKRTKKVQDKKLTEKTEEIVKSEKEKVKKGKETVKEAEKHIAKEIEEVIEEKEKPVSEKTEEIVKSEKEKVKKGKETIKEAEKHIAKEIEEVIEEKEKPVSEKTEEIVKSEKEKVKKGKETIKEAEKHIAKEIEEVIEEKEKPVSEKTEEIVKSEKGKVKKGKETVKEAEKHIAKEIEEVIEEKEKLNDKPNKDKKADNIRRNK